MPLSKRLPIFHLAAFLPHVSAESHKGLSTLRNCRAGLIANNGTVVLSTEKSATNSIIEVQDMVKPPAPDCLCIGNGSASLFLDLKCPVWARGLALKQGRVAKEPEKGAR